VHHIPETIKKNMKNNDFPFVSIHYDVWDPGLESIFGKKWLVTFVDDCTHITRTYVMKSKSNVFQIFIKFFHLVKNQFDKNIKELGAIMVHVNHEFSKFLFLNDIAHELTCVNTPQQNGIAERKNHHLLEVARALPFQMFVLKAY